MLHIRVVEQITVNENNQYHKGTHFYSCHFYIKAVYARIKAHAAGTTAVPPTQPIVDPPKKLNEIKLNPINATEIIAFSRRFF